MKRTLGDAACVSCGQCIVVCPTGALTREGRHRQGVGRAAPTRRSMLWCSPRPAVRATLGECFGMPIGTNVEGKMVAALRRLGFDKVFDTDFAADLTIMEEATEFLERVKNGGTLPLITSCSPGLGQVLRALLSRHDSQPVQLQIPAADVRRASIKTYYAEKMGLDPKNIVCVSASCPAPPRSSRSAATTRGRGDGIPDVDISITTRELGRMIERAGIKFTELPDEDFRPGAGRVHRRGRHLRRYRRRDGSGPAHRCGDS